MFRDMSISAIGSGALVPSVRLKIKTGQMVEGGKMPHSENQDSGPRLRDPVHTGPRKTAIPVPVLPVRLLVTFV